VLGVSPSTTFYHASAYPRENTPISRLHVVKFPVKITTVLLFMY
jgi:hypothetical protein